MNVILISCSCTKYTPWDYHILERETFESHHKVQNQKNVSPRFDVIWRNIYVSLVIAVSKTIVIVLSKISGESSSLY